MFGPMTLFPARQYDSLGGGALRRYYASIPFAGLAKSIFIAAAASKFNGTAAKVEIFLEHSLDAINWYNVEPAALMILQSGATESDLQANTKEVAQIARLVMEISGTATADVTLQVRAGGKPF